MYIFTGPGLASCRRRPLSSNVRLREHMPLTSPASANGAHVTIASQQVSFMKAFLSYARPNLKAAWRLLGKLNEAGVMVWFDKTHLLPGQRWEDQIVRAIREADLFILLLSEKSVDRRGFYHREISLALETLKTIPPSQIYVLPVRLDECSIPLALESIQWTDMFPDWKIGFGSILRTILTYFPNQAPPSIIGLAAIRNRKTVPGQMHSALWALNRLRSHAIPAMLRDLRGLEDIGLSAVEFEQLLAGLRRVQSLFATIDVTAEYRTSLAAQMDNIITAAIAWGEVDGTNAAHTRRQCHLRMVRARARLARLIAERSRTLADSVQLVTVRQMYRSLEEVASNNMTKFGMLVAAAKSFRKEIERAE